MNNYLLEEVAELRPERMKDKTWLVVHKLHRTPYHLGLIYGDRYFSLTVTGTETDSREAMTQKLLDKTYNNLLVELKVPVTVEAGGIEQIFSARSLDYQQFRSCLYPISEVLAKITANDQYLLANNLFELLDLVKKDNLEGQKMATRMTGIMESKIVLMRYDQETIRKHIKRLQELSQRETNRQ